MKDKWLILTLVLLAGFFAIGLSLTSDYGLTVDDTAMITNGHVTYKYILDTLHIPCDNLQNLTSLQNKGNGSYYGQAAVFPTIIIEAIKGFSLNTHQILRLRIIWNFLCFFTACTAMAWLARKKFCSCLYSSVSVIFLICMPKLFGDYFYNGRDTLFFSWMILAVCAFEIYLSRRSFFTAALFALSAAVAANARIFGWLIMLLPILLAFRDEKGKKNGFLLLGLSLFFWYLVTPILWKDPLREALNHLTTLYGQRASEAGGLQQTLFMGKLLQENDLPRYYLPLWIAISTPTVILLLSVLGSANFFLKFKTVHGLEQITDEFLMFVLVLFLAFAVICRPQLYNGWRHFYFLYFPIAWFALRGSALLFGCGKIPGWATGAAIAASAAASIVWIAQTHPYESIYYAPALRSLCANRFESDYWRLSTREGLEYIKKQSSDYALYVIDGDATIAKTLQDMSTEDQERFHPKYDFVQSRAIPFYLLNESEGHDETRTIPFYQLVKQIKSGPTVLAEIFQRTHNGEFSAADIQFKRDADCLIADVTFDREVSLSAFELFINNNVTTLPMVSCECSGKEQPVVSISPNGFSIEPVRTDRIRLRIADPEIEVASMLFYN